MREPSRGLASRLRWLTFCALWVCGLCVGALVATCARDLWSLSTVDKQVDCSQCPGCEGKAVSIGTKNTTATAAAAADLVERFAAANANASLTQRHLDWGITLSGDRARLKIFISKLLDGEPVKAAIIGGSNARGHLDYRHNLFSDWFAWLNATFPNARHALHNGAVGATGTVYMSLCLSWHVPHDVDLVWLEYSVNQQYGADINNDGTRAYERIVRKLLDYPNRPAVLPLHLYTPTRWPDFWNTPEDWFNVIGAYYRLPSVSWRNMAFHATAANASGWQADELWMSDRAHINELGRKYMAELMAGLVQRTALEMAHSQPYTPEDEEERYALLPDPLFKGNWGSTGNACFANEEFRKLVTSSEGWEWVNEGRPGRPEKVGYVAMAVGAKLAFVVDTTVIRGAAGDQAGVSLGVSHLRSYEHMGQAEVRCMEGCTCPPLTIDAHITERHSQLYITPLTGVSPAAECLVQVEVVSATSSSKHKFKVTGVMIGEELGSGQTAGQFHQGVMAILRPGLDLENQRR